MQCEICKLDLGENPCKKCSVLLLSEKGITLLVNKARGELKNTTHPSILKVQLRKFEMFLRKMKESGE